jgi:hypothetical protein
MNKWGLGVIPCNAWGRFLACRRTCGSTRVSCHPSFAQCLEEKEKEKKNKLIFKKFESLDFCPLLKKKKFNTDRCPWGS